MSRKIKKIIRIYIMRFCYAMGKGYDTLGKEVNKHNGDKDKMPGEIIKKK